MMTVVDSWWEPTASQLAAAKAQGIAGWLGYLGRSGDSLYHPWALGTFAAVKNAGLWTAGYCSGWDDPSWVRQQAAAVGITPILDVESSIRGDGAWVDPWLQASGAALYGSEQTILNHIHHGHPGYVVAAYPGSDPGLDWPSGLTRPAQPVGWQYAGSTSFSFGSPIDRAHFSAGWTGLAGNVSPSPTVAKGTMNAQEVAAVVKLAYVMRGQENVDVNDPTGFDNQVNAVLNGVADLHTVVNNILGAYPPVRGVTGPAGPPGPVGPQGPPGPAGQDGVAASHTHSVSLSGTTSAS